MMPSKSAFNTVLVKAFRFTLPRRLVEPGGGLLDAVALNVDLAPTLLELAGVPVPEGYEGESLVPLMNGESPVWRTDFLYEHHFAHPRIPKSEGVRGPRWTYARYYAEEPVSRRTADHLPHRHQHRRRHR